MCQLLQKGISLNDLFAVSYFDLRETQNYHNKRQGLPQHPGSDNIGFHHSLKPGDQLWQTAESSAGGLFTIKFTFVSVI